MIAVVMTTTVWVTLGLLVAFLGIAFITYPFFLRSGKSSVRSKGRHRENEVVDDRARRIRAREDEQTHGS
jgi:hypothetical protein